MTSWTTNRKFLTFQRCIHANVWHIFAFHIGCELCVMWCCVFVSLCFPESRELYLREHWCSLARGIEVVEWRYVKDLLSLLTPHPTPLVVHLPGSLPPPFSLT